MVPYCLDYSYIKGHVDGNRLNMSYIKTMACVDMPETIMGLYDKMYFGLVAKMCTRHQRYIKDGQCEQRKWTPTDQTLL